MKKFSFKRHPNPNCSCGGRSVKHGLLNNHNNTVQRYRCLVCNTRFLAKDDYLINIEPSPIVKHPGYANTSCVMLVKDKLLAFIDERDEELVAGYVWYANSGPRPYAIAYVQGKNTLLHCILIPHASERDHKNGNPLDNRRLNLRICTHQQNSWNSKATRGRRFKGIYARPSGRFRAVITACGVTHYLGEHATAAEAARAYDRAARQHFGEFAWLNFPTEK